MRSLIYPYIGHASDTEHQGVLDGPAIAAVRGFVERCLSKLQPLTRATHGFIQEAGIERGAAALTIAITLLTCSLVLTAQTKHSFRVFANEKRIVQMYVDGKKRTVVSSSTTVKEILSENGVNLKDGDVVEPAADTVVDQPNFNINVYRALPAVIVDNGKFTQVVTGYRSARKIAAAANVTLYPEDKADLEQVQEFQPAKTLGLKVTITRAKAVQIILNGELVSLRTHDETVGALLKEKGIAYEPADLQGATESTKIVNGLRVVISRSSQETVKAVEDIAPGTQVSYDANLAVGTEQVKRPGSPGRKQVVYLVEKEKGQEVKRTVLEETVLTAAVDKIVVRGSRPVSGQPSAAQWAQLRFCEAGGNYATNTGNGYYGAYQMNIAFWQAYGDNPNILPSQASPASQDAAAQKAYARRGSSPWPLCGRYLK